MRIFVRFARTCAFPHSKTRVQVCLFAAKNILLRLEKQASQDEKPIYCIAFSGRKYRPGPTPSGYGVWPSDVMETFIGTVSKDEYVST